MATYIMVTKLAPDALKHPDSVEELNRAVEERVHQECPNVKWIANYATLGPYDYVDVFEAPSAEDATKLSLLVRSFGHATTEVWVATPWERFVDLARSISPPEAEAARPAETEYARVRLKGKSSA